MPYKTKYQRRQWDERNRDRNIEYHHRWFEKKYGVLERENRKAAKLERKWRGEHRLDILALHWVIKEMKRRILLRDNLRICGRCKKIKSWCLTRMKPKSFNQFMKCIFPLFLSQKFLMKQIFQKAGFLQC